MAGRDLLVEKRLLSQHLHEGYRQRVRRFDSLPADFDNRIDGQCRNAGNQAGSNPPRNIRAAWLFSVVGHDCPPNCEPCPAAWQRWVGDSKAER